MPSNHASSFSIRSVLFFRKTSSLRSLLVITGILLSSHLPAQEVRPALALQSSPAEQSHFLAGQPLDSTSPLSPQQATALYLQHLQEFQKNWKRFESDHFIPKREWARNEMASLAPSAETLFYLFSGPDFINVSALFPRANTYVLVGLEPIGELTPPETLSDEQIAESLANLRKATETTLTFSYFITKDMRVDLERTAFRGVLPILYSFLALAGCEIGETTKGGIDANGNWVDKATSPVPGIRIRFLDPAAPGVEKSLFYLRGDLSNSGLQGASAPLLKWMRSLPAGNSYLKAASYLLHESYFSEARNFLLTHSLSILQDDSGIPIRFFDPAKWALFFYGTYSRPIELFDNKFQPELLRAYELAGGGRPLPFGTGYNYKAGESNLLLAVRKELHIVPDARPVSPPSAPGPSR